MLGDVVTDFEKSSIYIDYKLKSVSDDGDDDDDDDELFLW